MQQIGGGRIRNIAKDAVDSIVKEYGFTEILTDL